MNLTFIHFNLHPKSQWIALTKPAALRHEEWKLFKTNSVLSPGLKNNMASPEDVAIIQREADCATSNLESAVGCIELAARVLKESSADVALQRDAKYKAFHGRYVELAGLISRTNLPMSCVAVRGLSKFCDDCVDLSFEEFVGQLDQTVSELDKLRKEVGLAHATSKLMAVTAKKLQDELTVEIQKLKKKKASDKRAFEITAWVVGAVGAAALTGGLGALAFCFAGPAVATGAAVASATVAGTEVAVATGVATAGAIVGGGGGALFGCLACSVKDGQSGSLLDCAESLSTAMDGITSLLSNLKVVSGNWEYESGKPVDDGRYKKIRNYIKDISSFGRRFLERVERAETDIASIRTVEDEAVQEFFEGASSDLKRQLFEVNPTSLLETLQLQELKLDNRVLTRKIDAPLAIENAKEEEGEEEDEDLIDAGRFLKNVISDVFSRQEVSRDFAATSEALKLFGVFDAVVLKFATASAEGLRDYCELLLNPRGGPQIRTVELLANLPLHKERLHLGRALHNSLAKELHSNSSKQEGWVKEFIQVLEITSDCLESFSDGLEQIQKRAQEVARNPNERRTRKFFGDVRKTALEIKESCETYVKSFAATATGTPPLKFKEFAQTLVNGWLRDQPADIRALVRKFAAEARFGRIFAKESSE
ncbi:hypothetical protein BSKO_11841 [Bryopsis sp. KO-2023]|nr:hypothetical protein BSKO_11841 [Bryopsis sp. KO-2023]